ncbi:MAG: hypothetical protein HC902_02070 [Calothrix sp. SM1_5_4]|nr:hypothetical protein [Calothrix sp. SM1_5_4]
MSKFSSSLRASFLSALLSLPTVASLTAVTATTATTATTAIAAITAVTTVVALGGCASSRKDSGDVEDNPQRVNGYLGMSFGPNYKYNELMIKDYDEMLAMVQDFVKKSRQEDSEENGNAGAAVEYLGQALKLIFSRPDSDNMVAKLVSEVRRDLQGFNAYEDVIEALTVDALKKLKMGDLPVVTTSTALVMIENILGEIRPDVQNGNRDLRRVMQQIRDANIKVSSEVKNDRKMRGMFRTRNPSEEARKFLASLEKAGKK